MRDVIRYICMYILYKAEQQKKLQFDDVLEICRTAVQQNTAASSTPTNKILSTSSIYIFHFSTPYKVYCLPLVSPLDSGNDTVIKLLRSKMGLVVSTVYDAPRSSSYASSSNGCFSLFCSLFSAF